MSWSGPFPLAPDGQLDEGNVTSPPSPEAIAEGGSWRFADANLSRFFYSRPAGTPQGKFRMKRDPRGVIFG